MLLKGMLQFMIFIVRYNNPLPNMCAAACNMIAILPSSRSYFFGRVAQQILLLLFYSTT